MTESNRWSQTRLQVGFKTSGKYCLWMYPVCLPGKKEATPVGRSLLREKPRKIHEVRDEEHKSGDYQNA